jgi:ADP-ribose pyrophosphatase YjhB (NUDIX family)
VHHIQKTIIDTLAVSDGRLFSQLKPEDIENKLFTYHLKQLLSDSWIEKNDTNQYRLTAFGRRRWHTKIKEEERASRAFSVLYLVVRSETGEWLLYRRKTHPLKDKIAFVHATPEHTRTCFEAAEKQLFEKTGLRALFEWRGSGYFRTTHKNQLESYVHFDMLVAVSVSGDLTPNDDTAEYFWAKAIEIHSVDYMMHMPRLLELYNQKSAFFVDEKFSF